MTPAKLGSVFQVEDHEDVPEYEVVTVHHRRQRRGADRGHVHQVRHRVNCEIVTFSITARTKS